MTVVTLFGISEMQIEYKLMNKNTFFCNKVSTESLFDIYHFNKSKITDSENLQRTDIWNKRMQLYKYVIDNCSPNNNVYIADSWLNVYWYEAITNQRFGNYYIWLNRESFSDFYRNCEYVVIIPESEGYLENIDLYGTQFNKIYENEIGFIAKLK